MSALRKVFVRTPYNYDTRKASLESALFCKDDSLASQASKDECDINVIVRRFGVTGQLPRGARLPTYGDFEGVFDYGSALRVIRAADAAFMSLPADVRARFLNDPARFVDFCSDPANLPEMRKLGLANEEKPEVKENPTSGGAAPVAAAGGAAMVAGAAPAAGKTS